MAHSHPHSWPQGLALGIPATAKSQLLGGLLGGGNDSLLGGSRLGGSLGLLPVTNTLPRLLSGVTGNAGSLLAPAGGGLPRLPSTDVSSLLSRFDTFGFPGASSVYAFAAGGGTGTGGGAAARALGLVAVVPVTTPVGSIAVPLNPSANVLKAFTDPHHH